MIEVRDNCLHVAGMPAAELVKQFGSPLYAYDGETILQRCRELYASVAYRPFRLYFACKANSNRAILELVRGEGVFLDASSPGEIFLAAKAGYRPEEIMFTGNSVSDGELRYAMKSRVMVNADSLSQLERYGRLSPGSEVSVRINPDVGAGHHGHVITGGPESKFGIYFDRVAEIKEISAKHRLKIVGVHEHIGSGILDQGKFLLAMQVLLKTAREFPDLRFVDFGGGIGVPYRPGEQPLDMQRFGSAVSSLFSGFCRDYSRELELRLEPGRFLVAQSGVLLATVTTIKETPKHRFVGVDTGFNHLIRPMAYGSYHEILAAGNASGKGAKPVMVCGNLCESGDIFTRDEHGPVDRLLPPLEEGDILAFMNAGAYGFSMSSNYNARPRPAEVLVQAGKARLIRRAEAIEDMQ